MCSAPAEGGETPLLARLRECIRRDGPMPVDRYVRICQSDPDAGYWQRAGSIGAGGDFITAPEISQVFGELIGLWCAVVWRSMGRPASLRLIELGPGRGTLMRDALRAGGAVPGFLDATTVHLIEASAPLRELQRHTLALIRRRDSPPPCGEGKRPPIFWHSSIDHVPDGAVIVIANEFLDALPIRQLVFVDGIWRERVVETDAQGALRFATGPRLDLEVEGPGARPEPAAILELRAGEDEMLAQLARRQAPHVALFIDYGPAEAAYGDTLQAVREHMWVDPLSLPGSADLTAHVRFAPLARKARGAGLAADGPITQAEFLGLLGATERAARLMAANPMRAGEIETGVQRLISPTGMGALFKVLAVRSGTLPPPPPFV
jgi:NADH dehydrogenase [ubiquinone] 1 alpha subcomplex assembly factor 7